MTRTSHTLGHALAALALALAAGGCYKPSVLDGGFRCAAGSKPCPDDFSCSKVDNLCHRAAATPSDAGTCSTPPVTPVCSDPARAGQTCNPSCQNGCACGRCNVDPMSGNAVCTAPGAKKLGETCDPQADACAAGLICLKEACGNRLGRCYQHCARNEQCTGTICQIMILNSDDRDTGYLTCDLAAQDCDPVNNTGCPDAALNCYLTSANQTLCDCPNKMGVMGDTCALYSDCAPGFVCISNVGGLQGPHCHPVCSLALPSCPVGRRCIASSSKYGYCGI